MILLTLKYIVINKWSSPLKMSSLSFINACQVWAVDIREAEDTWSCDTYSSTTKVKRRGPVELKLSRWILLLTCSSSALVLQVWRTEPLVWLRGSCDSGDPGTARRLLNRDLFVSWSTWCSCSFIWKQNFRRVNLAGQYKDADLERWYRDQWKSEALNMNNNNSNPIIILNWND